MQETLTMLTDNFGAMSETYAHSIAARTVRWNTVPVGYHRICNGFPAFDWLHGINSSIHQVISFEDNLYLHDNNRLILETLKLEFIFILKSHK